jgi:hypothetical protein
MEEEIFWVGMGSERSLGHACAVVAVFGAASSDIVRERCVVEVNCECEVNGVFSWQKFLDSGTVAFYFI